MSLDENISHCFREYPKMKRRIEILETENQRLQAEVARLKTSRYPRTCWDGHDEIGHRLELGECPLCKSMISHDQRSIQLAASEADNDQLRTRIAELEAGLPLLYQIDEYLDKHPYPALDADIHWGVFHRRVKNHLAALLGEK